MASPTVPPDASLNDVVNAAKDAPQVLANIEKSVDAIVNPIVDAVTSSHDAALTKQTATLLVQLQSIEAQVNSGANAIASMAKQFGPYIGLIGGTKVKGSGAVIGEVEEVGGFVKGLHSAFLDQWFSTLLGLVAAGAELYPQVAASLAGHPIDGWSVTKAIFFAVAGLIVKDCVPSLRGKRS
jgi:hypothetical protein